ncbi:MAG: hypothetical protein KDB79_11060 [Acidobacteria bacterium]|nr:hypothetical protein [Acidobacteriota bacterium]
MDKKQPRFSRRTSALLWLTAVAIVIGVIIYLEQIALLYVLATVSLVVLLLVVGFSDLKSVDRANIQGFSAGDE